MVIQASRDEQLDQRTGQLRPGNFSMPKLFDSRKRVFIIRWFTSLEP
jgi:hypothetical protein